MNDTTQIVVPLAVSAIGALTYIAYKHPEPYKKLAIVLQIAYWAVLVGMLIWNAGIIVAKLAAVDAIDALSKDRDKIRNSVDAWSISLFWYFLLAALNIYVVILQTLPLWLLDQKPINDEEKQK
jgi:hypothetical protein